MTSNLRAAKRLLPVLLLLALLVAPAQGALPVPVGPGTSHLSLYQPQGPWAIHVLVADLGEKNLKLEALLGGGVLMGRGGVSGILAGSGYDWHRPIAGVNGDYFAPTGGNYVIIPLGFQVQNGELITLPDPFRSVFYLTNDGRPGIDRFRGNVWVTGPDNFTYPIAVMNRAPAAAQASLFTPRFGTETRAVSTSTQVILDGVAGKWTPNGQVTAKVISVTTGDHVSIPAAGAVIAANGVAGWALQKLKIGDEVTLRLGIEPKLDLAQAVGGGPRLLIGGVISVEAAAERFAQIFATRRHPRTALGLYRNQLVLVTVDGRQPGFSDGMTLWELARLMQSLGCTDAMNLDGGGSTTMVIRGKITNSPSDGWERKVANGLALFSLAPPLRPGEPPRPAARLYLDPQETTLLPGETLALTPTGLDDYCEPTPVEAGSLKWEVSESLGTVGPDGAFTAGLVKSRTAGQVRATLGTLTASAAVCVLPGPARLALNPPQLVLAPGAAQQFTVRAYDAEGNLVRLTPALVSWSCTPEAGAFGTGGLFRAPQQEGAFTVRAAVGEVSAHANVLVGTIAQVATDFEKEAEPIFFSTPNGVPGSAAIAQDPRFKGNKCLKLSYDFSTASEVRAAHAVLNLPLPDTRVIAVQVLGDGQGVAVGAKVRDSADHLFAVELTPDVDWTGTWRQVSGWLPEGVVFPVTLASLYVSEARAEAKPAGTLYFDDVAVASLPAKKEAAPAAANTDAGAKEQP